MAEILHCETVILGGGFGGLNVALELARQRPRRGQAGRIMLIDRHHFHLFTPILYQVATGLVEPGHIIYPLRVLAREYGFAFRESTVREVDPVRKRVITDDGELSCDRLVLTLGSATNFFGIEEALRFSLTLKTLGDAIGIRNRLVDAFERADLETNPDQRRKWLTFVVVGGGATGVELVGSMLTLINEAMLPTYPSIRWSELRLLLVEALPRLLTGLDAGQAQLAEKHLRARGAEVRLNSAITRLTEDGVTTKMDEFIPAGTVVWTAGVRPVPLVEQLPLEKGKGGRVIVNEYLEAPGCPGVYALGDIALFVDPHSGEPLPPNAAVAVRQGKYLGHSLAAAAEGSRVEPFRYESPGELVSLGRNRAVANIKGVRFDGFPAWLAWRSYYLSRLMGFKPRLGVLLDWSYAYFKRRQITRLDVSSESAIIAGAARPTAVE